MPTSALKATLEATIGAISAKPELGRTVFRAGTRLVEGLRCEATVRDFRPLVVDEPLEIGGTNQAMNPLEMLLVSLGTCQEILYAAFAAVMGIRLDEVRVEVKGEIDFRGMFGLDASTPIRFQRIEYETRLASPADDAALRRLAQTVESHCPLLDTFQRPTEVKGRVFLNGRPA